MTIDMIVQEIQISKRHTERAYYGLLTLRQALKHAPDQLTQAQIVKMVDDAVAELEPVIDGKVQS